MLLALAGAVALGVTVACWAQTPNFTLLYGNLSEKDSSGVLEGLTKANIQYKLDLASGAIMVPAKEVHEARLKLAGQGLATRNRDRVRDHGRQAVVREQPVPGDRALPACHRRRAGALDHDHQQRAGARACTWRFRAVRRSSANASSRAPRYCSISTAGARSSPTRWPRSCTWWRPACRTWCRRA
ncbi:MAG: hypothetical protein MZV65_52030 [Chromatiales bacterium]|nr:hypothetical protein [Chromatiales bacterium]